MVILQKPNNCINIFGAANKLCFLNKLIFHNINYSHKSNKENNLVNFSRLLLIFKKKTYITVIKIFLRLKKQDKNKERNTYS